MASTSGWPAFAALLKNTPNGVPEIDQERIRSAISKLPLRPGAKVEAEVGRIGYAIAKIRVCRGAGSPPTPKEISGDLKVLADALEKASAAIAKDLKRLHAGSSSGLIERVRECEPVLREAARVARIEAQTKNRRGPREKKDAKRLMVTLARSYLILTGRPPTRIVGNVNTDGKPRGVFLSFAKEVFSVAGRKDSPDSIMRLVRADRVQPPRYATLADLEAMLGPSKRGRVFKALDASKVSVLEIWQEHVAWPDPDQKVVFDLLPSRRDDKN